MCERIWPSSQHRRLRRGVRGGSGDEGRVSHIAQWGEVCGSQVAERENTTPDPVHRTFKVASINCVWRLLAKKMFIRYRWLLDWHRSTLFLRFFPEKKTLFLGTAQIGGPPCQKSILTLFDFDTFLKVKKSPKSRAGGRG